MSTCDGCGKERSIYRDGPEGLGFCFLCVKESERADARACPCGQPVMCKSPADCEHNEPDTEEAA